MRIDFVFSVAFDPAFEGKVGDVMLEVRRGLGGYFEEEFHLCSFHRTEIVEVLQFGFIGIVGLEVFEGVVVTFPEPWEMRRMKVGSTWFRW